MGKERNDLATAKKAKEAAIVSILMAAGGFVLKMAKVAYDNKKLTEINGEIADINKKGIFKSRKDKARLSNLKGQREQISHDDKAE